LHREVVSSKQVQQRQFVDVPQTETRSRPHEQGRRLAQINSDESNQEIVLDRIGGCEDSQFPRIGYRMTNLGELQSLSLNGPVMRLFVVKRM